MNINAIVLAAGLSRRMGAANKLLLPYGRKTVVETVVSKILTSNPETTIVVLGHEGSAVRAALQHLPVQFVDNPDYATGMTTSIQCGVRAAGPGAVMICLSDMPLIEPEAYFFLQTVFKERLPDDPDAIIMPQYNGQKGNPVIFSETYRSAILAHTDPEGCKSIVQANREHLVLVNLNTAAILEDMDYPEDYRRMVG